LHRAPLDADPDESVAQKRRYRRVDESISHARKRPAPVQSDVDSRLPEEPWYAGSLRLIREYLEGDGTIEDVLALDAGGGHVVSAMWHGIWSGQIPRTAVAPAGWLGRSRRRQDRGQRAPRGRGRDRVAGARGPRPGARCRSSRRPAD